MTLAQRIVEERKAQGLSMNKLAKAAGLDPSQVHKIETGVTKDPGVSQVVAIARALKVSVERLYPDEPATPIEDSRLEGMVRALQAEWDAFRRDFAAAAGLQADWLQSDSAAAPASEPTSSKRSRRAGGGRKAG